MKVFTLLLIVTFGGYLCDGMAVQSYTPKRVDPLLEPWRWRAVEDLDGVNVRAMDEAPDGTMWFGNVGSIAQYDGLNLKKFPFEEDLLTQDGRKEVSKECEALIVLPNGTPLFVVNGSLICWEGASWRVILACADEQNDQGMKLLRAQDGSPWLLTRHTLRRFEANLSDSTVVLQAALDNYFIAFCQDREGTLWVLKGWRNPVLLRIPLKNGVPVPEAEWGSFPAPFVRKASSIGASLSAGKDGTIWYVDNVFSTHLRGFDPDREEWDFDYATDCLIHESLMVDRAGTVWVGGSGRLFAMRGESTTLYSDLKELPNFRMEQLLETSDDRLWIRGLSGRVHTLERGDRHWLTYKGLNFKCEHPQGVQWFLSDDRTIVSHAAGEWLEYGFEDGVINLPRNITASRDGLLWVSGRHNKGAAIGVFDGETWETFLHTELALNIDQDSVFEAADGTMWFGLVGGRNSEKPLAGGVLQYEVTPAGDIRLRKHHLLEPFRIRRFAQAPDGTFWLARDGLFRYDSISGATDPVVELPWRSHIADMQMGADGALWVAISGHGVYQETKEGWRQYTKENGLSSDTISDLLLLQDGTFLAASKQGINRFDGHAWTKPILPNSFSFPKDSGSLHEDAQGSIWVNIREEGGRTTDITKNARFCTIRVARDSDPPATDILYFMEEVPPSGNSYITWAAKDRWGYTASEELMFSWRLDADSWSPYTYKTEQTLLELPSGFHTFEVRARDRDFNVEPAPARIDFRVIAPVWRQGWFVSMVLLFVSLIAGLIWVLVRIRERHHLEREQHHLEREQHHLEREQHLVEMDQLKTGFFTNISHELRTPLTAILGPLEVLLSKENDERKKKALAMMERNARRVSTLITQLLDFRKLEEGKIKIEATEGDIGAHIQLIVEQLEPLAKRHQIKLSCAGEGHGWFDPDKLEKIVTNLISNAIKYTPSGGEVWVRLTVNQGLELIVEDTGSGIGSEELARIFDRFYRLPEASLVDGTGIGLNLIKELVDLWGGEIIAKSPIHADLERPGTRFTVRLPIDDKAEKMTAPAVTLPAVPSDLAVQDDALPLVLIIEDDADIRSFIANGLEARYRVETAQDGVEGLSAAKKGMPDLIVTDLMMPNMDGISLCKELRADSITSHIPIIMLTAKSSLDHQVKGLRTGADDYITKPFHMVLLQTRIQNLLDSRRRLRSQFSRHYMLPDQPLPEDTLDHDFLMKVFSILEADVCDPEFDVKTLAHKVHMSLSTLRRKLKAVTDESPSKMIWSMRLKMGARLLQASSLTITEIAMDVGFMDSPHFCRQFKQHYGKTPSQYRADADSEKLS